MLAARIVAWLLALAILVLSVVPARLRPATGIPHDVEHFGIFVVTGFAFGLGYARKYSAIAIVIAMASFAGAVETAQLFVPGRYGLLTDFFLNTLALFYGFAAATSFQPAGLRRTTDSSNPKSG